MFSILRKYIFLNPQTISDSNFYNSIPSNRRNKPVKAKNLTLRDSQILFPPKNHSLLKNILPGITHHVKNKEPGKQM